MSIWSSGQGRRLDDLEAALNDKALEIDKLKKTTAALAGQIRGLQQEVHFNSHPTVAFDPVTRRYSIAWEITEEKFDDAK